MKKVILFVVCFMFLSTVRALENDASVVVDYLDNVYSNRGYQGIYYYGQQGIVYVNGELAYCLDPHLILTSNTYSSSLDFESHRLSDDDVRYLELISYFGYGNEGRMDPKYYLAAQELIWEYMSGQDIYWTDKDRTYEILVDNEKNEIMQKIDEYFKFVFTPTSIETYRGEDVVIEDQYDVLKYFKVDSEFAQIKDDSLYLDASKSGMMQIPLSRKPFANNISYIYYSEGSQALVTLGFTPRLDDTISIEFKVKNRVQLQISKKDSKTDSVITGEKTKIKIFDILNQKYIEMNNSDEFFIDESGILVLPELLDEGNYQIEELESPNGYELLESPFQFEINEYTDENYNIDFYNNPVEELTEEPDKPGEDPDKPGENPDKPGEDPDKPGENPDKPGEDPDKPGEDPDKPGEDPDKPGEDPDKPGEDPDKPEEDPDKPGEEPDKPREDPDKPGEEPDKPGEDPDKPGEDPDKPGEDPDKPGEDSDKPGGNPDKQEENSDKPGENSDKPGNNSNIEIENIVEQDSEIDREILDINGDTASNNYEFLIDNPDTMVSNGSKSLSVLILCIDIIICILYKIKHLHSIR